MPTQQENEADVAKMLFKHRMLASPSEREINEGIDQVTGFAMPVVKMSHFGDALKEGAEYTRPYLRRLVSRTNQFPNEGPQNLAERVDQLKHYVGLPSKLSKKIDAFYEQAFGQGLSVEEFEEALHPLVSRTAWIRDLEGRAQGAGRGVDLKVKK